ncbi:MAG: efflux RND transporter permease subunit [Oscillospiraceae bacterium]
MLSSYSVKKPFTVLVAVLLILVLGTVSFMNMTTDLLPSLELPYVVVVTTYPGASPEKVELSVTRPLESVLGTSSGLKNISSTSSENTSMIVLEFAQETNMDSAMIELSGSIDLVKGRLDSSVSTPMLMKISPDMLPIMVASVDVEGLDLGEVSRLTKETIVPMLERIDGVASVSASGLLSENIKIKLDKEKIEALNKLVMEDLDSLLGQTQAKLDSARNAINSGKAALEGELPAKQAQLAAGNAALNSAMSKINAVLAEEDSLNIEKQGFLAEKMRQQMIATMGPIFAMFPSGVAGTSDSDFAAIMVQVAKINPAVGAMSKQEMTEAEAAFPKTAARIAEIDIELSNITVRLKTIAAAKPALQASLAQAQAGYEQMLTGQMTMSSEIAKAQAQLATSAAQIDSGMQEFEDARKSAKESADLNTLITEEMVGGLLSAQNFSMPAGYINEDGVQFTVKVGEKYASRKELEDTLLFSLDSVGDIHLSDVAEVITENNAGESYAKVNGNDGLVLTFQKQSTSSTADVCGRIEDVIKDLEKQNDGLRVMPLMNQGDYIDMIVGNVLQNLLIGGILAIAILWLFLHDFKPTMVIACSIPISLFFAVTMMYFSKVTLNLISLSGLALGVGMLVDNSIVVIENIYRMRSEGVPVNRAAVEGAKQVSGAIFASTLTTVCVFLPIVFTQGISRQLFTDMGLTIAYSLLASLIVALTLVPAVSSTVFRKEITKQHKWFDSFVDKYEKLLGKALDHKAVTITIVASFFLLSIFGVTVMGTSFMPQMNSPQLSATLSLPKDDPTADLYALGDEAVQRMLTIEAVDSVGAMSTGSGMMGMGGTAKSKGMSFYILLKDDRDMTNKDVEREIYEKTSDMKCKIEVESSTYDMSMLGGSGIEIIVKGNDLDKLADASSEIMSLLKETNGVAEVKTDNEGAGTEVRIVVDKNKAMRENLTVAQVYSAVAQMLKGESQSTILAESDVDFPVIIVGADKKSITRDDLHDYVFHMTTQDGKEKEVRLSDIASISETTGVAAVKRENQSRFMSVRGSIAEGHNIGIVSRDFEKKLANYVPPVGCTVKIAGETESINSAMNDLVLMILLAIIFIYLIMVAQFQSLLSPFIVLFTMPLAFTGGLLLLWACGMELSVIALLGFLVLAGVVVNNGIVFVDYVNQLRLGGMEKRAALIETGRTRIRPILMTALTTILAMSTLALGIGNGAEMTQPMAIVTIGGLTYATALTLIVIPIMYDIFHKKELKPIEIEEKTEGIGVGIADECRAPKQKLRSSRASNTRRKRGAAAEDETCGEREAKKDE